MPRITNVATFDSISNLRSNARSRAMKCLRFPDFGIQESPAGSDNRMYQLPDENLERHRSNPTSDLAAFEFSLHASKRRLFKAAEADLSLSSADAVTRSPIFRVVHESVFHESKWNSRGIRLLRYTPDIVHWKNDARTYGLALRSHGKYLRE